MQKQRKAARLFASLIAIILPTGIQPALAQQPADPEELIAFCKTVLCRPPTTVRLILDDGSPYEVRFEHPLPILQNDWVSVFPGETVYIEADRQGDRLVNLQAVESNKNPEKTIVIHFEQAIGMLLEVTNPYPQELKYHAGMMLPSEKSLRKTSSCSVVGNGGVGFEQWPHPIFQMALKDFRLLPDNIESCEY